MNEMDFIPLYIVSYKEVYSYTRMVACGSLGSSLRFIDDEIRDYLVIKLDEHIHNMGRYRAHVNQILYLLDREDVQKRVKDMVDKDDIEGAISYLTAPLGNILPNLYGDIKIKKATQIEAKTTNIYKCINCSSRKITTTNIQIRSLDEGASISFTCVNCGHEWVRG